MPIRKEEKRYVKRLQEIYEAEADLNLSEEEATLALRSLTDLTETLLHHIADEESAASG